MKNQGSIIILLGGDDPNARVLLMEAFQASGVQAELRCYTSGASSCVTKPQRFDDLVAMIALLGKYWLEVVELPPWTPGDQHVRSTDQTPLG
jgi:hypothetical protein